MENKNSETLESAPFSRAEEFQAKVTKENEEFITITDGRITATSLEPGGHDESIKDKFGIARASSIFTLYVEGIVSVSGDKKTASGKCVFFVSNGHNHKPLTAQNEFIVKKSTAFYYRTEGSDVYQEGLFRDFVTSQEDKLYASTSSTATGHRAAGLFLKP